jgi:cytoskeleton protein RodZ
MNSQIELITMKPGDILRHARKQQGLTIEQASRQSKIKPSVLSAIETGETQDIPSVYLRGYIRNYARFLGVDPADLKAGMDEVKGAEPEIRTVFTVKSKRNAGEKWLKATSYLAASALIATLAWQFTHEAVRFSQGETGLTSGTAVQSRPGEPVAQDSGQVSRSANTHLSASIASVESLGQPEDLARDRAAEQAWRAISNASATVAGDGTDTSVLSISTSADTWVEISDSAGHQLELDLLRAGSSRKYDGQPPFNIMIGRASAVELSVNGSSIDLVPHTRGDVARMTLQPK